MTLSSESPDIDISLNVIPSVFISSSIAAVISGMFFLGRVVSRRIQHLSLDISDYVLLYGLVCCWGFSALDIYLTKIGLGWHMEYLAETDPTLLQVKKFLKLFIILEMFYDTGLVAVKLSILIFYRTLFPGPKFRFRTNILMAIVIAWGLGNVLPSIFACRPISGFWEFNMSPPPVCINKKVLYVVGSTANILTDVAILILPVTSILRSQLNKKSKTAVICLLLLGGL